MAKRLHTGSYALGDFIAAMIAWSIFYSIHRISAGESFEFGKKFLWGLILYPCGFLVLYYLFGAYKNIYYKSRVIEMLNTFVSTFMGGAALLIIFILYNSDKNFTTFYKELSTILIFQFLTTYFSRFILLSKAHHQLQKEEVWFNTLIIGCNENALQLYKSITTNNEKSGYRICGFITTGNSIVSDLAGYTQHLGTY